MKSSVTAQYFAAEDRKLELGRLVSNISGKGKNKTKENKTKHLPRWCSGRESACTAGDISPLGNPMDRGAWRAKVHKVAKILT